MPPEAIAPMASSGCTGSPSLRTTSTSRDARDVLRDGGRHGDAATREAEYEGVGEWRERRGEPPARIHPVGEQLVVCATSHVADYTPPSTRPLHGG